MASYAFYWSNALKIKNLEESLRNAINPPPMTILEACAEIDRQVKPYIGIMSRQLYSHTLGSIRHRKAKMSTIEAFLRKFGYEGEWNEWRKAESCIKISLRTPLEVLGIPPQTSKDNYSALPQDTSRALRLNADEGCIIFYKNGIETERYPVPGLTVNGELYSDWIEKREAK